MKKRLLCVFCSLVMLFTLLAGCSSGEKPTNGSATQSAAVEGKVFKLRCAGIYPPEYPITLSLVRAADTIREKTNGKVNITVYPANQLGDWSSVYQEVMQGTIDMASCMCGTTFDSRFEVLMMPYIAIDYESVGRVYAAGSNFYKELETVFSDADLQLLNIYLDGFMGIAANKINRENLLDPTVAKGLTYRVPGTKAMIATAKGLGYIYSSIPFTEVYSALQTGIVDGWMGCPAYPINTGFSDVTKYFIDMRYCMEPQQTFINAELLASMPKEYQTIILETYAAEGATIAREREAVDVQALKDLEAKGIEVIRPSMQELSAIRDYFHKNVWPDLIPLIGEDIYQAILKDIKG